MNKTMKNMILLWLTNLGVLSVQAFIFLMIFSSSAYAYVDPVGGSIILQVLLASLMGGILFFRRTVSKIYTFLLRRRKKEHQTETIETITPLSDDTAKPHMKTGSML